MLVLLQKLPSKQGDTVGFQYTEKKRESMCLCVCVLVCSCECNTCVRSQFLPAMLLRFTEGMKAHFLTLGIEYPEHKVCVGKECPGNSWHKKNCKVT